MRRCLAASPILACVAAIFLSFSAYGQGFAPKAADRARLLAAIAAEEPVFSVPKGVTGITVPHHLLAADLIARGFWAASGAAPERIVLIAPDHFHLIPTGFSVAPELSKNTVLGDVSVARRDMRRLLQAEVVTEHPNILQEHGITALLPFIAHFFPTAEVIVIVASTRSTRAEWEALIPHVQSLIRPGTLVVQSTDFSHFLPIGEAVLRDQQTLDMLATGDPERVGALQQPDHLDSPAALYLQLRLQNGIGSRSAVLGNRNSVHYGGNRQETTSYVTLVWHPDDAVLARFAYDDQNVLFLAGDTLLGRGFTPHLERPEVMARLMNEVLDRTGGVPIVLNLEGVLVPDPVANAGESAHVMTLDRAGPTLRGLNVVAAGLANNHAWDFGKAGRDLSLSSLQGLAIAPLEHGAVIDHGGISVVGINLLEGSDPFVTPEALETLLCALDFAPPAVGLVHWGIEYTNTATPVEEALADAARRCGITALVGAHSHQASDAFVMSPSGLPFLFSLGNFMFDQNAARSSGALVELRRFEQGTLAMRRVSLPHLFSLGFQVSD